MTIKKIIVSTILLFYFTAIAFADDTTGYYVEGNIGHPSIHNPKFHGKSDNGGTLKGLRGSGVIGYQFNSYLGLETGYTQYGKTKAVTPAGVKAATDKYMAGYIAGKAIFPMNDYFRVFSKIGVARGNSKIEIINTAAATTLGIKKKSSSSNGFYIGIGADALIAPNTTVNIQWNRAHSHPCHLNLLSAGLTYLFM